jgi:hypothetical protein
VTVFEDSALAYAQQEGFYVFPLKPRDKVPLTTHGLEDATTDAMTIETWWAKWPNANVGVRCGTIVVVDEDRPHALEELAYQLDEVLPRTRVAITGKGRHYYFTQPESFKVRNTASKLAQGIDTRGEGGYVVAPPSIHPNGHAYTWEVECDPAPLPAWLAELLRPQENGRKPLGPVKIAGATTPYGQKALEDEARAVAAAPEGTRNDRLNIAAFSLGQLIAGSELDEWDARNALADAARACGLGVKEAEATIASGINGGLGSPRTAPEGYQPPPPKLRAVPDTTEPLPQPTTPLKVVSLDEFASITEDIADPLIGERGDALLPSNGLLFMYGDGGAGKTTLSVDALAHLAAGASWLETKVERAIKCLLIENEGPRGPFREMLAGKIAKWKGDPFTPNVRVLEEPWSKFTLAAPHFRTAIANEISEHEIDLVIVGPLASLGAKGAGTPDDVSEFNTMIVDLHSLTPRQFALWIVHHENKAGDVSGAWERLPDTLVHVSAQGNGRTRVHWRKVRWSSRMHNTSVVLLWDDGGFTLEEARQRDLADELLDAFHKDDRWRTATEAGGLIAANKDRVREVLTQLVIEGTMSYQIGPEGRTSNAKCWRLSTGSGGLSHPEPVGLFEGHAGRTGSLARATNEPVEPSRTRGTPPSGSGSAEPDQSSDDLEWT